MAQAAEGTSSQQPFSTTTLYVGDLDPNTDEAHIYHIFSAVSRASSVKICRDKISKRSLGYGYVNYSSADEAARSFDALQFTEIEGKPVRVMFSSRDPNTRRSGMGNIFVKNLDKNVDNKALHDLFSKYGKILSSKVALDAANVSKGYGFVQFESEESGQKAIEQLNGTKHMDKTLYVGPFIRRQERDAVVPKFNNVFVKNLAETTTDAELKELFGKYGPISSAVVMKDEDGKSKCFGFVNFENSEDAAVAVEELNGKSFQEKELYVGRAQKKTEREAELKAKHEQERRDSGGGQITNLYLKNLDDSIDEPKLTSLFEEFGTVKSCKVLKDLQGHSKGAGFVSLASIEAANRAVGAMNGRMIANKPLYVAVAEKKEERKAKLEAQFASRRSGASFVPGIQRMQQQPQVFFGDQHAQLVRPPAMQFGYLPSHHSMFGIRPRPTHVVQHRSNVGGTFNLASALASSSREQQRMLLGERLYPLVENLELEHAGKITGMLLEMDQTEILHLLESPNALNAKVAEALHVLNRAQQERWVTVTTPDLSRLTLGESIISELR